MKLIFTQPKFIKVLPFCLLLSFWGLSEAGAKIIVKYISVTETFHSQAQYFDINDDGIDDIIIDNPEVVDRITQRPCCYSYEACNEDPAWLCQELVVVKTFILTADNLNKSINYGDIYSGKPSSNYLNYIRWTYPIDFYMTSRPNSFEFYKPSIGNVYFLDKNKQPSATKSTFSVFGIDYWGTSGNKYIAFQIIGKNGGVCNAWMRKNIFGGYEIAYEDIPGYPIVVGDYKGMFSLEGNDYNIISGVVYQDQNNNCTKDATEKGVSGILIKAVSNNDTYYGYTNTSGAYELLVKNKYATYTLSLVDLNSTSNTYVAQSCTLPAVNVNFYNILSIGTNLYPNHHIGVKSVSCAPITLNLQTLSRRRCAPNVNYVNYRNNQNSDENDFLIKVLLPEYVRPISSVPAWTSISGDTLFFSLGTLAANTSGQIKIIDSVICWNPSVTGTTLCTKAWALRGCVVTPSGWDQSEIKVTSSCLQNKNYWTISNKGKDMTDSAEYRIFYDNVLVKKKSYKLSAGGKLQFQFTSEGHTIRVEADQSPHHPFIRYAAAFIEGCGAAHTNDFIKNIAHAFPFPSIPSEAMSCMPVVDSYDPNDKNGYPTGFGDEHLVEKNTDLTYTIRFQNTGTADAYTVLLVDSLSQHLDPLNIELLASSHPYRLEYRAISTPVLMWIFENINLTPESVDAEASQGFVTYRIKQKPNLSDGTVIQNKAYIYFDYNDAIITNTTVHTIGKPYTENILKVVREPEDISFCKNDPTASLYTLGAGMGVLQYQWKKDGQDIIGSTKDTLSINRELLLGGNYYCEISNFMDTIQTRSAVVLGPFEAPDVFVLVSNASPCQNEFVTLSGMGASSYTWNQDVVDGQPFVPSATKMYTVTGTDVNGCLGSSSVTIEVLESPLLEIVPPATECIGTAVDITTIYTDLANTEGIITYWKDVGAVQLLENPTAILQEGIYYIKKEANSCSDLQPVVVTFEDCQTTSIAGIAAGQTVSVFPNPSSDYIQIKGKEAGSFVYKIYSTTGVLVGSATTASHEISVVELPAGNYYLEIHQAQTVSRFRFNKQ